MTFLKVSETYTEFRSVGQWVQVYPLARIVRTEVIDIGNHVIIDDFVFLDGGRGTIIGDYIHIAAHSAIMGGGKLLMEDFSGLSGGVRLYTGGDDYHGKYLTNPTVPFPYRQPHRSKIVMRKHSLVGSGSIVIAGPDGLEIGEGAAVGAMSLVKDDLEPWMVYAGVPARPIKKRDRKTMLELEQRLREKLG